MKVFYNKQQTVKGEFDGSPSARKPMLVVQSWKALGLPIEMIKPRPVGAGELSIAHDPKFVNGVLGGRIKNGFGNKDMAVAKSLPWTVGSLVSAAAHAAEHLESTFSPTSGFHHARFNNAAGYCTFSGLTIASLLLKKRGLIEKIGILDLDSHAGDGTDDTIQKTGSASFIEHYSLGYYPVDFSNNKKWLSDLPELMKARFSDCNILLFQAGVDCHEDDPNVDKGHFSTEQLAERDRLVYETAVELELPVVTTLAGGYQIPFKSVLELHDQTALAYAQANSL